MKRETRLTEEEINYTIYNALNLYNEDLGEIYLNEHFNPFPNSFELTEDFVVERFVNSTNKKELNEPYFLSEGSKKIKQCFDNSVENCKIALAEIEQKLADPKLPDSLKEELKKLKTYLLCRIELLSSYSKKIKKNKNTLKMYNSIESLDWRYGELFEETYSEQFNTQIAINAFLEFAKQNSNLYKQELENKALREKAQNIIKENQQKLQSIKQEPSKYETKQSVSVATKKAPSQKAYKEIEHNR